MRRNVGLLGLLLICVFILAGACGRTSLHRLLDADQKVVRCGNGVVENEEACDDGNLRNFDACTTSCQFARCGDGIVHQMVEACDDGNSVNADGCRNNCSLPSCGDGIVDPNEVCDDGNTNNNDDCPNRCLPAICGDGFTRTGIESCDQGPRNAERPAFELVQNGIRRPVHPRVDNQDPEILYDYQSASSHIGDEKIESSFAFIYRKRPRGDLSLFFYHGADFDGGESEQPEASVMMSIKHLPKGVFVAVADDHKPEFRMIDEHTAEGDWRFRKNTDGGVLSGFGLIDSWALEIEADFIEGINAWSFWDSDKSEHSLELFQPAWLVAYGKSDSCRPDCTQPVCGDGILDGGEICDDANRLNGDGCSADCSRLE